jgi:MarR family multiple antibiotic resistance transcriptional regulator
VAFSFEGAAAVSFFDDLVRSETRLYNGLNDRLREAHGIVTSQLELLRFVRDHPGARVADIAQNFAIGVGATSKGLDRAERGGWVRRVANPADRRSSLLELTGSGRELAERAEATFVAALDELLGPVATPDELASAAALLGRLRASLEAAGVGLPTG